MGTARLVFGAVPSTTDGPHVLRSTRISFAGARRVLDAAVARATELGTPVCVEIVDPSGEPVLAARMDGAALMSSRIAADKAYTVVAFNGRDTEVWVPGLASKPEVLEGLNKMPRFCILGGGVGLWSEGELIGAVGVSGASVEQDVEVAKAAAAAVA